MSRYEGRLLQLQIAAENCKTEEERSMLLGELAAMVEARTGEELQHGP